MKIDRRTQPKRGMDPWTLRNYARSLTAKIKHAEAREKYYAEQAKTVSRKDYSAYKLTEAVWRSEAHTLRQLQRAMRRAATAAQKRVDLGLSCTGEGGC